MNSILNKRILILGILMGCLSLIGCVPFLNPLYTDKDLITVPGIEGKWQETESLWTFQKNGDKSYTMTYARDTDNEEVFKVNFVRLGRFVFMDMYPQNGEGAFRNKEGLMVTHYIPTHTISKVQLWGDNLQINMLNADWFKDMMDKKKVNISYEIVEDGDGFLVTAKAKDIQRFIKTYSEDSNAFEKPEWKLTRYKEPEKTESTSTTTQKYESITRDSTLTMDTSTTVASKPILPEPNKDARLANPTLYMAPLSSQVNPGQRFQINLIMDNPQGKLVDDIGLWIKYNPESLRLLETKPGEFFDIDSTNIYGWSLEMARLYSQTGELFIQLQAKDTQRTLSGILGKLNFQASDEISISQIQFKFGPWDSLPNTYLTNKSKDVLGREKDHRDGTISAAVKIHGEKVDSQ